MKKKKKKKKYAAGTKNMDHANTATKKFTRMLLFPLMHIQLSQVYKHIN